MTSVVRLTQANAESYLDGIMEIEKASFLSPWSRNAFVQELKNPVSHLWILLGQEKVEGYVCFWMFDSEIQLINVAVRPEKRGKGFGNHLLRDMIKTAMANGMRQVWLEVRMSNSPARRLYEKLGFVTVGRRPRYYRDTNEDAIVMSLGLSEREEDRRVSN